MGCDIVIYKKKHVLGRSDDQNTLVVLSHVPLFATPWTVACQAPLSKGFITQECYSSLPFPSPGDLADPGIEPGSPALQADSSSAEPPEKLTLK